MKRIAFALVVALSVASLVGCGSGSTTTKATETKTSPNSASTEVKK